VTGGTAPSPDRARGADVLRAHVQPFPWGALESLAHADVDAARALRRWAGAHVRLDETARALGLLVGAEVGILTRGARRVTSLVGATDGVAVLLAPAGSADLSHAVLLEVEGALAATLVARGVRRSAPRVVDPSRGASPLLAGAFGAVVVAAARRVHGGSAPLRVLAAGPAPALARDASAHDAVRDQASFTVTVDAAAYEARASVPRTATALAPDAPWTSRSLAALGDMPIALAIVAASTRSTAADVGALQRGDAWMPGDWSLTRTKAGGLAGPVLLAAGTHELGVRADLGEDGRLVLRGDVEGLEWTPGVPWDEEEEHVGESDRSEALVEAVGEVPVVVRVEIGVAEMRAREWASLGRGDVVALGRKIGEPVTLRVGGVTVARGELVDIDGEIGVRILGRADSVEGTRGG
jgi:flagellar motor switch/type III secretory pathway protein FliN